MKKILISVLILILIIVGYLLFRDNRVKIYLHIANPSEDIDLSVKIGERQIFNDSLRYNPYKAEVLDERLRIGVYTISVSSNKAKIKENRKIFVFFDQYIAIQYSPKTKDNDKGVSIDNLFYPFYYE